MRDVDGQRVEWMTVKDMMAPRYSPDSYLGEILEERTAPENKCRRVTYEQYTYILWT